MQKFVWMSGILVLWPLAALGQVGSYSSPGPWSGVYFGFLGSAVNNSARTTQLAGPATSGTSVSEAGAGVFAGYNAQVSNWIIGFDGRVQGLFGDGALGVGTGSTETLRGKGIASGRVGVALGRLLAPYVSIGVGLGEWRSADSSGSTSDWRFGWVAGVGVDYALSPNIIARAEYTWERYRAFSGNLTSAGPLSTEVNGKGISIGAAFKY